MRLIAECESLFSRTVLWYKLISQPIRTQEKNYMPILGLIQAVKFCREGNNFSFYLTSNTAIDFATREYWRNELVPLLNPLDRTICGVRVGDLSRPIVDLRTQKDIETELRKLKIKVWYKYDPSPEFVAKHREKGKTEKEIERYCVVVKTNKLLREDTEKHCSVIWSACNPDLHSFEFEDRKNGGEKKTVTVAEYFLIRYGKKLKYPEMPLVFLGNKEWFPIEFLFQSFSKMRDANKKKQVGAVLEYYNEFR